ncbi:preprotein translocase subunit SecG [Novosphingobium sp. ZN18A2]|uniref:preprotein translocase subunit SecG n=1 Tax=Novosphingobium sp. ZN18A2 TaxID=3079861 RepID=UPI0030D361D4
MFIFLTVLQALVAAALVTAILMQQSEGGGLGVGGSPGGLMSARGAASFITRATAILATIFVILSIVLAALAVRETSGSSIDTSLDRSVPAATQSAPAADPLAVPGSNNAAPAQQAPAEVPAGQNAPAGN